MTDMSRDATREAQDARDAHDAESRRPLTPLEKARAAVRSRTTAPAPAGRPSETAVAGGTAGMAATARPQETSGMAATAGTAETTRTAETTGTGATTALLPQEECDELASRMRHAVVGFVDGPRDAVAEADHVLEELAERVTDAVNRRRRTLRGSWQPADRESEATAPDTEQLRLALRDYRELSERLLHV
ncbi:hypothetical protein [Streptomyces sp. DSM 15324]|uniref:hypothetical protein n=1 Tax=Streptomyces sp. DSM 15324 TaxID=1739111 RepID=UPI00074AB04B|nr:hypothetical protein [Streptomyces sp. DSM 15324]KUO14186.1 hypothetical protein AQJ58_03870 [Streptomyces sp. DSM 15324]